MRETLCDWKIVRLCFTLTQSMCNGHPVFFVIPAIGPSSKGQIELSKCNTILMFRNVCVTVFGLMGFSHCLFLAYVFERVLMNPDQLVSICILSGLEPWSNILMEPLKLRVNKTTLYITTSFLISMVFYSRNVAFLHGN